MRARSERTCVMVTACYAVERWQHLPPVACLWASGFKEREQAMGCVMTLAGMHIITTLLQMMYCKINPDQIFAHPEGCALMICLLYIITFFV